MDTIRIAGGRRLEGRIPIGGAKNAALPLMAACLLTDQALTLRNLPHLADISTMMDLLAQHGVDIHMNGDETSGGEGYVLRDLARLEQKLGQIDAARRTGRGVGAAAG